MFIVLFSFKPFKFINFIDTVYRVELDLVHCLLNALLVALDGHAVAVVAGLRDGDRGGGHLRQLL